MLSRVIVSGEIMRLVQASVTGDNEVEAGPASNRVGGIRTKLAVVGALVAAVAFGVAEQQANMHHLPVLTGVSGMSAPWLVLPFLLGAVRPGRAGVALLGFAAACLAVGAYVAMSGDPTEGLSSGHSHLSLSLGGSATFLALVVFAHAPLFLGAAVSGPLYAVLGRRWRVSRRWPPALAVTAPVMLEPAARWLASYSVLFWAPDPPVAWAEAVAGLALTAAAIAAALRGGVQERPGVVSQGGRRRPLRRLGARAFCIAGTAVVASGVVVFCAPPVFPQVYAAGNGALALALAPDGRTLYVVNYSYRVRKSYNYSLETPATVTPIDTATMQARRPIEIAPAGWEINDALVTRDGRTMYALVSDINSTRDNWVAAVNLGTGARERIQVPGGADQIALSPDDRTLYVSTDDNAIMPVSTATGRPGRSIPLPPGPDGGATPDYLALAPDGRTMYVVLDGSSNTVDGYNSDDELVAVDTVTGRVTAWAYRPHDVNGIALAPDGRTLYLTINGDAYDGDIEPGERYLIALNTAAGSLVGKPVALSDGPVAPAVTPDGRDLIVLGLESVTLTRLAPGTGAPSGPVSVGDWFLSPTYTDIAISPDGRTLYLAASDGTHPGGIEVIRIK